MEKSSTNSYVVRVYIGHAQYEDYELTTTSEHNAKVIARESAVRQFGVDFHSTRAVIRCSR